ncbi:sensor histidine kinase [Ilyomonas limi]|uniref:Oxygen sensor histidine kinase NreB n=1 Tax=Ilyomonas limi TaxID=2575867 RepID=A0A4U3L790_9BACT|nr:sensor histidine kinase [Ilyomonas limi]TKK70319.1 sensor histidine kinase [Ilyomonas limi]
MAAAEIIKIVFFASLLAVLLLLFFIMIIVQYRNRYNHYIQEKLELQSQYNEALLQSQLETHESTLHQISEELHDNIGQLLSSTKMLLDVTGMNLNNTPDTFKTAEATLNKAIQDLRALSKSLNKEWLHQFNIVDNLKAETERINTAGTIHIQYTTSATYLPLQPEAQVMLFRIVQEALQNSIKHAHARDIAIQTSSTDERIIVTVEDDGIGINQDGKPLTGVGILNMQHRTKLLGGTIAWNRLPNRGTQVLITLPVQQENR